MMKTRLRALAAALTVMAVAAPAFAADQVNLYSARKENLILPLLDKFSEETGIEVNMVTGGASELIARIRAEGRNTPADLLLTTDAGRLHVAQELGLLQPLNSDVIEEAVPEHVRGRDNNWIGLSQRSRVIVYSKERVDPAQLSTYEDLADPKWKGKICVRSSDNIYNQSLLASMIAHDGSEQAEAWAEGIVANMARTPQGNDRAQVTAVAAGECDVALVNNYYVGAMTHSSKDDEREAITKIGVFYPNQDGRGAHMNVSGIGLTKYSRNKDNAVKLVEFLVSDEAQTWYAETNHEYPVRAGVPVSETVGAWGYPFKQDDLPMATLGENNAEAVRIFDRAGWK
ncbi:Fe(3+) ABC transporter substrate-binding protein [Granulosicoccaceae sp. 1_MG-2023]|nr:Fe(3+) ABC transporter substrate-binding protein [Granulosicoccaceae sp. 1_MG-2023]